MNIGLDVGYSAVKAVSGDRRISFYSAVGTPDQIHFSLNGFDRNDIVLVEPDHVRIGDAAVSQSRYLKRREDRGWIRSEEWYYLVLAALTELTKATLVDICLVTGLPVTFYADKEQVRDRLLGKHKVVREGRRAQLLKISDCRVIPQPFGTLLGLTLDDRGRIVDEGLATGSVGVIDVGGKTTNFLRVHRLAEIARETASVSVGIWDLARGVRAFLADRCPDLELRDHQLIAAITSRQVRYYGKRIDLAPTIDAALAPMAEQVIAETTQLWSGAASLDVILVTGGGAMLLGSALTSHFPHARVVANPVFGNAVGFWRFAQRLDI